MLSSGELLLTGVRGFPSLERGFRLCLHPCHLIPALQLLGCSQHAAFSHGGAASKPDIYKRFMPLLLLFPPPLFGCKSEVYCQF